jgi:hypothetical protein
MTTDDEHGSQLSNGGGPDQPSDELEHWLSDLRTEAGTVPSGWVPEEPEDRRPREQAAEESTRRDPDAPTPSGGGRHRAAD